jgi:hypothetical protein
MEVSPPGGVPDPDCKLRLFIIGICAVYGGEDAVRVATVNALSFLIALVAVFYIFTPSLEAGWQVLAALG